MQSTFNVRSGTQIGIQTQVQHAVYVESDGTCHAHASCCAAAAITTTPPPGEWDFTTTSDVGWAGEVCSAVPTAREHRSSTHTPPEGSSRSFGTVYYTSR